MIDIETTLKQFPVISRKKGENLITQGQSTDSVYFLIEGDISIIKDDVEIALTSQKGSVFGEMSILLGSEHSATVYCVQDSTFYQIEHPRNFLSTHPEVIWHISQILSLRLSNLNRYLVDIKHQYDDHVHKTMVSRTLRILAGQEM